MTYQGEPAGKVAGRPFQIRKGGDLEGFWTFRAVEERLVDALRCWRRASDPEARFGLGGKISSLWGQVIDDTALVDRAGWETEAPRPLPLSRADMARMTEASDWLAHVPEGDRRLVVNALAKLANGHAQVPWLKLKHQLGIKFGAEGLRKRYSRSLTLIANALNMAENREDCGSR